MILVLLSTVSFGGNSKAWIDGLKQLAGAGAAGGAATAAAASGGSVQAVLASAGAIATAPATLPILAGVAAVGLAGLALAKLLEDDD
jgi:hypothetical protein